MRRSSSNPTPSPSPSPSPTPTPNPTPNPTPTPNQEIASFESETAAVLAISRHRVKMVETRPLASEWQVVDP